MVAVRTRDGLGSAGGELLPPVAVAAGACPRCRPARHGVVAGQRPRLGPTGGTRIQFRTNQASQKGPRTGIAACPAKRPGPRASRLCPERGKPDRGGKPLLRAGDPARWRPRQWLARARAHEDPPWRPHRGPRGPPDRGHGRTASVGLSQLPWQSLQSREPPR